jgi:hypothetical protein
MQTIDEYSLRLGARKRRMKYFELINDDGLEPRSARDAGGYDASGCEAGAFSRRVMDGTFHIEDDPSVEMAELCLCSKGSDECWHCGRGSKP